ncbi:MAG: 1-acyl-sn-glycerol-3-phosphate acyltransferase [Defluviitaleaceae bacterium]|nr:1-acyl-sn-glycerol-3-phosphate acyltransferase [Defluviitaleaceae bacterium]
MLYRFARRLIIILSRPFFRFEVTGREHIPKAGAVILCCNHIHLLDCLLLAVFVKRQVFFMAKIELFRVPLLGRLLRRLGAFPVDRGTTDLKAYRHTMELLKNEKALGIFSQGTRTQDFDNVKGGVGVFALKSGAPVVPVGISGTYRIFSKMRLRFGPPISMEQYQGRKVKSDLIEEVMADVMGKVSALAKC